MTNQYDALLKARKVVESCETIKQWRVAERYVKTALRGSSNSLVYAELQRLTSLSAYSRFLKCLETTYD